MGLIWLEELDFFLKVGKIVVVTHNIMYCELLYCQTAD